MVIACLVCAGARGDGAPQPGGRTQQFWGSGRGARAGRMVTPLDGLASPPPRLPS